MTTMTTHPELLLNFLYRAANDLKELTTIDRVHSRDEIRTLLLQRQHDVLNQVVEEFNNDDNDHNNNDSKLTATDVQNELKLLASKTTTSAAAAAAAEGGESSDDNVDTKIARLQAATEDLNEAARLAYCRLVLFSGCLQELQQQQQISSLLNYDESLKDSGGMSRNDILELCGLCTTALRLPLVQQHLEEPGHGTPLFDQQLNELQQQGSTAAAAAAATPFTSIFPHERLERIQRIFLQMMGYNADYATAEIKRIFSTNNNTNNTDDHEFTNDEQVMQAVYDMMSQIKSALTKATIKISEQHFYHSDIDQGGSTRIVAVDYSEHEIDAQTGQVIATTKKHDDENGTFLAAAPKGQAMEENADAETTVMRQQAQQQQAMRTAAVAAAKLQQEILAQVLSLPELERQEELLKAKQVSQRVMQQVLEISTTPGRVEFLRSLDSDTQRLLALHKLWETHVTSKNSKANNNNNSNNTDGGPAKIRYAPGFAPE